MINKHIKCVLLISFLYLSSPLMAHDTGLPDKIQVSRGTAQESHESEYRDQYASEGQYASEYQYTSKGLYHPEDGHPSEEGNRHEKMMRSYKKVLDTNAMATLSAAAKELGISLVQLLSLFAGFGAGTYAGGKLTDHKHPPALPIVSSTSLALVIPFGTHIYLAVFWQ